WKSVRASGNIAVLQRVFANEFTNTDGQGRRYTKAEWIEQFRGGDPGFKDTKIDNPKLISYDGHTATLTFTITTSYERNVDLDVFVKRGGRWQVLSSQSP